MRAVLSFEEDTATVIRTATEVTKETIGQNAPALVNQTVPLQRRYWAMPRPKRHGMAPNAVAVTSALRRILAFSIHCSFRKTAGKEPDRMEYYSRGQRPCPNQHGSARKRRCASGAPPTFFPRNRARKLWTARSSPVVPHATARSR